MKNKGFWYDLAPFRMKWGLLVFSREMVWLHFYISSVAFNKFFHVLKITIVDYKLKMLKTFEFSNSFKQERIVSNNKIIFSEYGK